jgi:hypothetical protein
LFRPAEGTLPIFSGFNFPSRRHIRDIDRTRWGKPVAEIEIQRDAMSQARFRQGEITMSAKTNIAAIAAFVAVIASTELVSAQALFNDYARPQQTVQAQTVQRRAARLPADAYASTGSARQVRSSQHDFQLGGEHAD